MSVLFSALKRAGSAQEHSAPRPAAGQNPATPGAGAPGFVPYAASPDTGGRSGPLLYVVVGALALVLVGGVVWFMQEMGRLQNDDFRPAPENAAQTAAAPGADPASAPTPAPAPVPAAVGDTLALPPLPAELLGLAAQSAPAAANAAGAAPPTPAEDAAGPDPSRAAIIHIREGFGAGEAQGLQARAYAALNSGDPAAAERAYRDALLQQPDSIAAREGLAVSLLRQPASAARAREAARLLDQAQNLSPTPSARLTANQARALATLALTGDAGAPARLEALARGSDDPVVLDALASLLLQQKQISRAEDIWLRAIRAAPMEPALRFNLASLYDRQGDSARAAAYYREALNLAPQDPSLPTQSIRQRLEWLEARLKAR